MKNHECLNCSTLIDGRRIRCRTCYNKERKINPKINPTYRHGLCTKNKRCIECGIKLSTNPNAIRCKSCNLKLLNSNLEINKKRSLTVSKIWTNKEYKIKLSGKNSYNFGRITHGKGSYYKNIWMRSSYEVAYAKYLDKNNVKWLYEPKTFDLGNTTYTPDFYLPETDEYIEIKGYWREDAKIKFRLFRKLYSNERIIVLDKLNLISRRII